jgi:hypothetical protein
MSSKKAEAASDPELAEGDVLTGELTTSAEFRQITEDIIMGRGATLEQVEDPEKAQEMIVRRILAATTEEEILREDSTIATRDLVGVPLEIHSYRLMKSTLEDKAGSYLIVDAVALQDAEVGEREFAQGELLALNTGAPKIMAQIIQLERIERLPAKVKVIEVGQEKAGRNRALQLAAA